jgi:16S rRNA (uracil1498-N3)-methyltransferase
VKQFLLKEEPDKDGLIRLRDEDYHYLVHVKRLRPGSVFTALLPASTGVKTPQHVTVRSIDRRTLVGITQPAELAGGLAEGRAGQVSAPKDLPDIVLFQALPKGTRMDLIVRQAAEGGISEVVPFVSEHSVPKGRDQRMERWRRIVKEARQQSGSAVDTRIRQILTAGELFAYWEELQAREARRHPCLGLVFMEQKPRSSMPVHEPLAQGGFHRYLYKKPPLVVLAVGPEGGFSGAELDRFTEAGFKPLSLGDSILRTETAALYGAAAVKIILMERTEWTLKQQ